MIGAVAYDPLRVALVAGLLFLAGSLFVVYGYHRGGMPRLAAVSAVLLIADAAVEEAGRLGHGFSWHEPVYAVAAAAGILAVGRAGVLRRGRAGDPEPPQEGP